MQRCGIDEGFHASGPSRIQDSLQKGNVDCAEIANLFGFVVIHHCQMNERIVTTGFPVVRVASKFN